MRHRYALHAALTALALTIPTAGMTQSGGDFKSGPLLKYLDTLAPAAQEQAQDRIATQLSACLQPLFENGLSYAPVIIETQLGTDGRPSEPQLLDPAPSQAARPHMRQLLRAEMALFDCAPVTTDGAPITDMRLAFVVEGDVFRVAGTAEVAVRGLVGVADVVAPAPASPPPPAGLTLGQRREAQVRLNLAGVDPGEPDGVFGPQTLSAVQDWQDRNGYTATGELTQPQVDALWEDTQAAYEAWARANGLPRSAVEQRHSSARYYTGSDGCLRARLTHRIEPGQSQRCDALGLVQRY